LPSIRRRSGSQPPLVAAQRQWEGAIFGGAIFGRFGGRARLVLQIIPLDLPIPSSSITLSSIDVQLTVKKSCVLRVDGG